jgi:hypothetical protein
MAQISVLLFSVGGLASDPRAVCRQQHRQRRLQQRRPLYASLSTLEVITIDPFTGDIEDFQMMPGKGRVAVSPSGKLYFMPADYFAPGDILAWDLPTTL